MKCYDFEYIQLFHPTQSHYVRNVEIFEMQYFGSILTLCYFTDASGELGEIAKFRIPLGVRTSRIIPLHDERLITGFDV